jgi:transcriptional regulator with XRE-family HTH domain
MITGEQIRASRGLAHLDQAELAERAGVSLETINRLERLRGPISAKTTTEAAIREAFGAVDVIFLEENGYGCGVRFGSSRTTRSRSTDPLESKRYA